jgi:hypothetical protein
MRTRNQNVREDERCGQDGSEGRLPAGGGFRYTLAGESKQGGWHEFQSKYGKGPRGYVLHVAILVRDINGKDKPHRQGPRFHVRRLGNGWLPNRDRRHNARFCSRRMRGPCRADR